MQKTGSTVGASPVVTVPTLTAEQEQTLRERFRKEDALKADSEEGVFTNPGSQSVYIPDLGMKSGDSFSAECFAPGETKDLKLRYRLREIRASKHLAIRKDKGELLPGRVVVETASKDPLSELGRLRPTGTFADPLSGKRYYDLKLKELEERERRENGELSLR